MNSWYKSWFDTNYYHLLYKHRSPAEAQFFIQKLLPTLNLKQQAKILDIACGKGRHAKAMAEMHYQVEGIDLSKNAIEEAKKFENDYLHFAVHDMRNQYKENYFDAAFNLFTSFGYFDTTRDNERTALAMTNNLIQGGLLIIDFINTQKAKNALQDEIKEEKNIDSIQFSIVKNYEQKYFIKRIEVQDGEQIINFEEKIQALVLEDFLNLFQPLGMQLQKTYGSYQLDDFDILHSDRLIMQFQKQ